MKTQLSLILLNYFRLLARLQLAKIKLLNPRLKIIGITGSAGKTSTINACEAALESNFRVKTTAGSNSESGIPLNILGIKVTSYSPLDWLKYALLAPIMMIANWRPYDIYLVEMGIDGPNEPKNMSYLLKIVKPDIGIFLNVSPVHLQYFDSLDSIAREKAKLVNSVPLAIINSADPLVKKYSQNPHQISLKPVSLKIPNYVLPPIYDVTFSAVFALTKILGLTPDQTKQNLLANFHLPYSRCSLFQGINNSTIIDSTYNSSPLAAGEMLKLLSSFESPRIAVLGDMRELGLASPNEHLKLYQLALKSADTIISVGPETTKYFGPKSIKFDHWWQADNYLKQHLPPHSTLLVKGSQNTIFLEELVKELLQNPKDNQLLCRQSSYWLNLKNNFYQKSTASAKG
jgi:UDP-N-acetylmuramoyl-tripeptide--D-alanyl-D-alanine ligase